MVSIQQLRGQEEEEGRVSQKSTSISLFSTFGSKINEFGRKKSEKNEKIPKT
jgi:hypothetical protein